MTMNTTKGMSMTAAAAGEGTGNGKGNDMPFAEWNMAPVLDGGRRLVEHERVFSHGGCADGFGAAFVLWKGGWESAERVTWLTHGAGDEEAVLGSLMGGETVLFVDYCPPVRLLVLLAGLGCEVTVLDHHKTALPRLWEARSLLTVKGQAHRLSYLFDESRSGAGLAFDLVFGEDAVEASGLREEASAPPGLARLIDSVEDRDLWRWALGNTREIMEAVFARGLGVEEWDELMGEMATEEATKGLVRIGAALSAAKRKDIMELIDRGVEFWEIGGLVVPAINAPSVWASEAGNVLADRFDCVAAVYQVVGREIRWSLRSVGDLDASAVASLYGGGGHLNAAGFRCELGDLMLNTETDRWAVLGRQDEGEGEFWVEFVRQPDGTVRRDAMVPGEDMGRGLVPVVPVAVDVLGDVRRFHGAFGLPVASAAFEEAGPERELRDALLREEFEETMEAKTAEDYLDGLVDLIYIAAGTAVTYGWDLDEAWRRVHGANMAKLGADGKPIYREDGKVMKPEGWKAASLADLVGEAGAPRGV